MGINTGALYIIVILVLLAGAAFIVTGPVPKQTGTQTGTEVMAKDSKAPKSQSNLQLLTFGGATITPPAGSICQKGGKNTHPEIIIGYSPAHAKAVPIDGRIKVWLSDTKPLLIAPAEKVARNTGIILEPGDRQATAPDELLWEPAIYIFPDTVDRGGKPYFPVTIKGHYNNGSVRVSYGMDQIPYDLKNAKPFIVEYAWNVKDLGLKPGAYQLQFSLHDGNEGRAIGCISIRVYDVTDPRWVIPD